MKPPEKVMEKFKDWYGTNSSFLQLSQELNGFEVSVRYLPEELNVIREISKKSDVSKQEIKELYKKYSGTYEFSFKVSRSGVQDLLTHLSIDNSDYENRLFYLIESIGSDFTLVTTNGDLKPVNCHFENNYGNAPFLTFHLSFEKLPGENLKNFVYQDQTFGLETAVFDLEQIEKLTIPKIK